MRGLVSVAAGVAVVMLVRFLPAQNLWTGIAFVVCLAVAAGFLTAAIAQRNRFRYTGMLGLAMVILAVFMMRERGASQPGWFELAIGGCGPIAAYIGTGLRMLTARR